MNYQRLWGMTALGTMMLAIVLNVVPFVSGIQISIEQRVLMSLLLLVPSVLHVERTATLESIRKMVEGSVQSTVLISNKDIWNSYHRLINTSPDRGHIRAINFYTNIEDGKAVESSLSPTERNLSGINAHHGVQRTLRRASGQPTSVLTAIL